MANFKLAVSKTLELEGGYVNDPQDPGGATRYGITQATARSHGYNGDMRELPIEVAEGIYRRSYWDVARLTEFSSQAIAENVFDCNVNCGATIGGWLLQQSLNLLRIDPLGKVMWPALIEDRVVGNATIEALESALRARRDMEELILVMMNCLRAARYVDIVKARPDSRKFMIGWMKHRVWLNARR